MELNFNKIDDLNATLVVELAKTDYAEAVEKELKKHQKQAVIKGFRPGSAPLSMIKNMYGKSILIDEINRLASQGLYSYLKEQNIDIIAQPLPSENVKSDIDIDNKENYTFAFDLGLAPTFEFNISENDSLDKYIIEVSEDEVTKELETLRTRHGVMEAAEKASEKDVVYGVANELNENSEIFEGGIQDKNISFTPELIKDEAVKNAIIGITKDQTINVNIFNLFNENHSIIASTLGISKEAVADLNPIFSLNITDIQSRKLAELDQNLFNTVMGEGIVSDLETFKTKIKENLEEYYRSESDHQIEHMISHLLEEKHNVPLPNEFLKRWLLNSKEEQYNTENIDERYENESKVLKEILIREKAATKFNITIEQEDIEQASLGYTLSMFRNYGLQNPDFEFVKKFSDDSLKKPEFVEQMNDIAIRRKVYNKIKEIISYKEIPVTIEEFYKRIEEHNALHKG